MMNDVISRCEKLVLTDMSDGMLKIAKGNLGNKANVEYQIADIRFMR
nr:class I SAM-dependent methyltransferase [uncultured Butyrivibrio sp.]